MGPPELNERYAIEGGLVFREAQGGLPVAELCHEGGTAVIALQGAQLLVWRPADEEALIWLSKAATFLPGKAVRGGVPVCWPWFGAHKSVSSFPAHGFARTSSWHVITSDIDDEGCPSITLQLDQNRDTEKFWPYPSVLECRYRLSASLAVDLTTTNSGNEAFVFSQALHTYFAVSDIARIQVCGLEGHDYLDKVGNFARLHQQGSITFPGEVDRIYLDARGDCKIVDPGFQRRIVISKQGSRSTVVWNPGAEKSAAMGDMGEDGYRRMVCVESANAAEDAVRLEAGESHTLSVLYRHEKL